MFFGVRLPGPFRVGVTSSGRVIGGVSAGPFTVSGQLAAPHRRRRGAVAVVPVDLTDAVYAAREQGWKVTRLGPGGALLRKGLSARYVRQEVAGVSVHAKNHPGTVALILAGGMAALGVLLAVMLG